MALRVDNATSDTVEVRVTVAASLVTDPASTLEDVPPPSSTNVLVSGDSATTGIVPCGNVMTVVAGAPGAQSTSVVLTGDGTGTPGFDGGSVGSNRERFLLLGSHFSCGDTVVSRGRLFQRGIHFECGDVITVAITATNNQFQFDDDGFIVVDTFGNPTIQYNVGFGQVTVTKGN